MISSSQRLLPDNTQHSQQTDIHVPGGIRTHNLSWRSAADLRLRPRGYWDRKSMSIRYNNLYLNVNEESVKVLMQFETCELYLLTVQNIREELKDLCLK